MRLERKKNTIRSTIWGTISRVITIIGPFIIRTIIIKYLGQEFLGLSSLFSSILQVLSLAELGFSSAIAYSMYEPIANNDENLICSLLNLFRKVYKFVGIVILVVGLMLMPFLKNLIHGSIPNDINMYLLYILYLANSCVSYFLFSYNGVLFSAFQREDIVNKIYSSLMVIQYILQIVLLMAFKNYYFYYMIVPVISILNNIALYLCARKTYPQYVPNGKVPNYVAINIRQKLYGVIISKFCGLTRNTFDSIIISSLIGLTAVAIYSNYYYILSNISAVIVIIITSMRAGIGNSVAIESESKNHNDFNKFTFMYMWIAGWCSVCLLCLYQPFMKIWTGEKYMFPFSIVVMFVIYFFGLSLGDIVDAYSGAVGLWWENRYRTIGEALTNLFLNILLGYFLGIFGVVLATVVTIYGFNFIWKLMILYKYYFKSYKVRNYICKVLYYILTTIVSGGITYLITMLVSGETVLCLLKKGAICVIIPNIIYFILYRKLSVYLEAREFVTNVFNDRIR